MSIKGLSFDQKVAMTILAPVAVGVIAHQVPKILAKLFPDYPDGRVGQVSRHHVRQCFNNIFFNRLDERGERVFAVAIPDNIGIAVGLVTWCFFDTLRTTSSAEDMIQLSGLCFVTICALHTCRRAVYSFVAPALEQLPIPGGRIMAPFVRRLGPSDWQNARMTREEMGEVEEN